MSDPIPAAALPESPRFVDLARAIAHWRRRLGDDAVLVESACRPYEANCIGLRRSIPVVLRPRDETQVRDVVRIAKQCKVSIYPISTGKNWGYGAALPTAERSVVVDLSRMRRIKAMEPELGLVTVQPGVTQGDLRQYLDRHNLPFMVPVTGAGPSCSLVGNALERGYGITPHTDHFLAVRSLRAVLPDGRVYQSALTEAGGALVDGAHKWGVGPYLDGLYSQGGFGVVTEMTIALASVPERVDVFTMAIENDDDLGEIVDAVRDLLQRSGGAIGGINLMNRLRLLSMLQPYPWQHVPPGGVISDRLAERLGREARLPAWMGLGAIYGDHEVVAGLRQAMRRRFRGLSKDVRFVSRRSLQLTRWIGGRVPGRFGRILRQRFLMASEILGIASGVPSETPLRLAYWKSATPIPTMGSLDPARDGCGIVWFAPLVPMRSRDVRKYVALVGDVCRGYGVEPLITLTTVSNQCFDSTIPILFQGDDGGETARRCYEDLFSACQKHGYLPYRMNAGSMPLYTGNRESTYWHTVQELKAALDPEGIFSPGRYAPTF